MIAIFTLLLKTMVLLAPTRPNHNRANNNEIDIKDIKY